MSSSVQVQPLEYVDVPLCNESAKDTEKTVDGFFKHCPAAKGGGSLCHWVALVSHSHPHTFLQMCPVGSLFLEPLKTLFSFNETFLFVTSKFNLSVTGMEALVSKLHGGPVVV